MKNENEKKFLTQKSILSKNNRFRRRNTFFIEKNIEDIKKLSELNQGRFSKLSKSFLKTSEEILKKTILKKNSKNSENSEKSKKLKKFKRRATTFHITKKKNSGIMKRSNSQLNSKIIKNKLNFLKNFSKGEKIKNSNLRNINLSPIEKNSENSENSGKSEISENLGNTDTENDLTIIKETFDNFDSNRNSNAKIPRKDLKRSSFKKNKENYENFKKFENFGKNSKNENFQKKSKNEKFSNFEDEENTIFDDDTILYKNDNLFSEIKKKFLIEKKKFLSKKKKNEEDTIFFEEENKTIFFENKNFLNFENSEKKDFRQLFLKGDSMDFDVENDFSVKNESLSFVKKTIIY